MPDVSSNDYQTSVTQHLNHMSIDQQEQCMKNTRAYLLRELPDWLLKKYIFALESLSEVANEFGFVLTPEEMYIKQDGNLSVEIMINPLRKFFYHMNVARARDLISVNSFMKFVREGFGR